VYCIETRSHSLAGSTGVPHSRLMEPGTVTSKGGQKNQKLSKTNGISTLFLPGKKMVVVMRKDGAGAPRGKNDFDGLHSKVGVGAL
jgi:hypothetical protein